MTLRRKFGLLALISLAALTTIQPGTNRNVHASLTAGAAETECNARDPLSRCATDLNVGYPLGDGLVFTPIEDFL